MDDAGNGREHKKCALLLCRIFEFGEVQNSTLVVAVNIELAHSAGPMSTLAAAFSVEVLFE